MGNVFYFAWEIGLMQWLQAHIAPAWMAFISQLSLPGEDLFLVMVLGFVYWCRDKKLGQRIGWCLLLGSSWSLALKDIVQRLRPYFVSDGIELLRKIDSGADTHDIAKQGFAFPSGHSFNVTAVFGTLAVATKKKWLTALAVILPLLVGFSRVAVGAHFPTDVFAGWMMGLLVVWLVPVLQRALRYPRVFRIVALLSAAPGLFFCTGAAYYTSFGLLLGLALSEPFEAKFVRFAPAKGFWRSLLRLAGGIAVYLVVNALLKLPFSADFLEQATTLSYLVRAARYAIVSFIAIGVYPLAFKKI